MLLETKTVEKPWGQDRLPPPFDTPPGKRIGEIWFVPPRDLPQLLVKYLFTSEALSVQVHPSDAQTEAAGLGRQGKEECWLVIDAEPGATLGIGFRQALDAETMRAAALDGSIEAMLEWHPVEAGGEGLLVRRMDLDRQLLAGEQVLDQELWQVRRRHEPDFADALAGRRGERGRELVLAPWLLDGLRFKQHDRPTSA